MQKDMWSIDEKLQIKNIMHFFLNTALLKAILLEVQG